MSEILYMKISTHKKNLEKNGAFTDRDTHTEEKQDGVYRGRVCRLVGQSGGTDKDREKEL